MKPELLAPAGDLQRAKTAIRYGADAVYLGGKRFSLRSRASNFELADIAAAVQFAKQHHAKIYVTVNMIPHEDDLEHLEEYLVQLQSIGVSAVIVASVYIAILSKKVAPLMEVHLSTQQSVTNSAALLFYQKIGVDRVVLAREALLAHIQTIAHRSVCDLEVFIHGGMCVNYSGRCTLSNLMTLRDANRGGCAQSCRWKYRLYRDKIEISDPNRLFSMSSKDLIAAMEIPVLMDIGIKSLKIEGRMKSAYYIAIVVDAYRKLIDAIERGENEQDAIEKCINLLKKANNRPTANGFFHGIPQANHHLYGSDGEGINQEFVATVKDTLPSGKVRIILRNNLPKGIEIEVLSPQQEIRCFTLDTLERHGVAIDTANISLEVLEIIVPFAVMPGDFLRKKGS